MNTKSAELQAEPSKAWHLTLISLVCRGTAQELASLRGVICFGFEWQRFRDDLKRALDERTIRNVESGMQTDDPQFLGRKYFPPVLNDCRHRRMFDLAFH
jgi:hypothetical protein